MNKDIIAQLRADLVEGQDINNGEYSPDARKRRVAEAVKMSLQVYPVILDREVQAALEDVWCEVDLIVSSNNYGSHYHNPHLRTPEGFMRTELNEAMEKLKIYANTGKEDVVFNWRKGGEPYRGKDWAGRKKSMSFYHLEDVPLMEYLMQHLEIKLVQTQHVDVNIDEWL